MHCRRARSAILERRLAALSKAQEIALEQHLEGCGSCAGEAVLEASLARRLAALRDVECPEIDVTARVMREARALGAPAREVSAADAVWAALLGAALFSTPFLAGLSAVVSSLPGAIPALSSLSFSLARIGASLASALTAPLHALARIGVELLTAASPLAGPLAIVGRGVAWTALLLMIAITAVVVGRDLARRDAVHGR